MLNQLTIRWNQFIEEAQEKSFWDALRKSTFKYFALNRVVVPVYNDLSKFKQGARADVPSSLEFLVVNEANVDSFARHKTISRKLKGVSNTASGFYAYAVVANGEIIGDIWCATPRNVRSDPLHSDLSWLGIKSGKNEAYMFDMYVAPSFRGKVTTSFLLGGALSHLKGEGFDKVYGYYEKDNLPALWTHRLFGYTELGSRKVSRFLFYTKSEPGTARD